VRGEAAEQHLKAEQRHHQEQVLAEAALRRRERHARQRILRRRHGIRLVMTAHE
jgi:hypothetical protein